MKKSTDSRNWAAYYAAVQGRPPRATLVQAMRAVSRPGGPAGRRAIDLGCGAGRDALPLLAAGWHVLAIDAEPAALRALTAATPPFHRPRLVTRQARLERTFLPAAELVNASFSLFSIERLAVLADLVRRIRTALVPEGRFAGQFLGPRDSWVRAGRTIGIDRPVLGTLFGGFVLERLDEEEGDAATPHGESKYWHIWHVVAAKREGSGSRCIMPAARE